jgi:hypothetical protein
VKFDYIIVEFFIIFMVRIIIVNPHINLIKKKSYLSLIIESIISVENLPLTY